MTGMVAILGAGRTAGNGFGRPGRLVGRACDPYPVGHECAPRRPVPAPHRLPPGVGHRPLRFPLRLLHGRADAVPAQARAPDAGGAGPALHRLRPAGRAQAAHHRGRAAGAAGHHDLLPRHGPASGLGRPRGADADHQRLPARPLRRRARGLRRSPGERVARHPARGPLRPRDALGPPAPGPARDRRRAGGGAAGQDQHRGAARVQRGRAVRAGRVVRVAGHGPDLHRGHADGRPRRGGPGGPVLGAVGSPGEGSRSGTRWRISRCERAAPRDTCGSRRRDRRSASSRP